MTIKLNLKLVLAVVLAMAIAFVLFHSSAAPFANNQWKPHRWLSKTCNVVSKCSLMVVSGSEVAYYDVCLEHGELRRIK